MSPAEIHSVTEGAVPSQPRCHGQVPVPGWLLGLAWLSPAHAGAEGAAPEPKLGPWAWSQLKELHPQAPGENVGQSFLSLVNVPPGLMPA